MYQPVHSSTIGGGGGALSAKSAAPADWIATKEASIAPAKRSFFIGSSPDSWPVAPAESDSTLANRRADSCDTSATSREKTRNRRRDGLTVGACWGIGNI